MDIKCCGCGKVKPEDEYHRDKRQKTHGRVARCKSCVSLRTKKYYQENKDVVLEKAKDYYIDNKESVLEYQKEYYEENKEYVDNRNKSYYHKTKDDRKEKHSIACKRWKNNNPKKLRAYCLNRVAKRNMAKGKITKEVINEMFFEQNSKCYYCGKEILSYYEVDHKTPLSRGGNNLKNNLCLTCDFCNTSKGSKTEDEYKQFRIENNY